MMRRPAYLARRWCGFNSLPVSVLRYRKSVGAMCRVKGGGGGQDGNLVATLKVLSISRYSSVSGSFCGVNMSGFATDCTPYFSGSASYCSPHRFIKTITIDTRHTLFIKTITIDTRHKLFIESHNSEARHISIYIHIQGHTLSSSARSRTCSLASHGAGFCPRK